jgi:hypothetical protein
MSKALFDICAFAFAVNILFTTKVVLPSSPSIPVSGITVSFRDCRMKNLFSPTKQQIGPIQLFQNQSKSQPRRFNNPAHLLFISLYIPLPISSINSGGKFLRWLQKASTIPHFVKRFNHSFFTGIGV